MAIVYTKTKRSKRKSTKATRSLDADWEALLAKHTKPLEYGAKAKGSSVKTVKVKPVWVAPSTTRDTTPGNLKVVSVPMTGAATLPNKPTDLQDAIHKVSSRVGISYNKGGLQYLSDAELQEQRTGAHKRRP